MSELTIKTGSEDAFFQRGRQLARTAEVVKLITTARFALFRAIKGMPGQNS